MNYWMSLQSSPPQKLAGGWSRDERKARALQALEQALGDRGMESRR
jgi:hypothetical protein